MGLEAWNLPDERVGRPAPDDLAERRKAVAQLPQNPDPAAVVRSRAYGGVACLVVEAPEPDVTVLYLHGGGYRLGEAAGWTEFAARLASAAHARIVLVDYRLAPEAPFPGALRDAAAAYDAAYEAHGPLVVAGDSAGGGLAAALALAARDAGRPAPLGLLLLSPWLDQTFASGAFERNAATDGMFGMDAARVGSEFYLQGHDPHDPLVSPLLGDLAGLPRVQLFAGGHEVLLDDATAFAARAAAAGVTVEAHFVAGMQHVWPTVFPELPESRAALAAMTDFLRGAATASR
ncbi:alpha/beta hydrolase [Yinghuangia seranimata]|uniref:alpha/beta hydrolase n=1 Tax=Yinghuangia seranimata TaxID=408067 RepID=UPI00248D1989|nr:alpha/beta hydrolase [Yinghuangia seranimata]MDI2125896.1 alpha/beta hydrolase [Yinghuangia seranimata]